jgi:hypothetical protein
VTGAGGETIFERRSKFGAKPEKRGPGQSRGREKTGVKDPETRIYLVRHLSWKISVV